MKPATLRLILLLAFVSLAGWLILTFSPSPHPAQPHYAAHPPPNRFDREPAATTRQSGQPTPTTTPADVLTMANNPDIDADERIRRITELGQSKTPEAARALMSLGDEDTYLNFAALQALAHIATPEVAAYLTAKLQHPDPRMVAAAAISLATIEGARATPAIAATLANNRRRPDGQHDVVCAACVEAFRQIGAPAALPALAEEFDQTVGVSLSHDYGARLVSVIRSIGDPAGIPILQSYLQRLEIQKANAMNNPKGQEFFQVEINKTKEAIDHLGKSPE